MNIGIDARMYGPKQTGIGNYIKYLIEELLRLDEANTYYLFLAPQGYEHFVPPRAGVHKVKADFPWYSFGEQLGFARLLYRYPLDLMHFPHFNVPLLYRKPFVVTIHDLTPKFFPGEKVGKSWLRRQAYEVVLRHAIFGSRAIITPSRFTKDDILRYFAVDPDKIQVIPEGIPLPQEAIPSLPAWLTPLPYLLYVGVWRSHKNLAGLIKAFGIVKKEADIAHKLVLIGDPDMYYQNLASLWEECGVQEEILPIGFQDDSRLFAWYAHASLLVLPSFYEGFGLTPLTSLALGVPVAVSRIGALQETLGNAAFYFDPHSPSDMARVIRLALSRPAMRQKKLTQAALALPAYRWEAMAKATRKLFEQTTYPH